MAGGKGTRIRSVASDIPKPMIKIEGMPVLERAIRMLAEQGFRDVVITVGYLGRYIMDYFGNGSQFGVSIEYLYEDEPLGNAGALFKFRDKIGHEDFFLLNGDVVFDIDFRRMLEHHDKHRGLVTIFTHPNDHPYDSGLLLADKFGCVQSWIGKDEHRPEYYHNKVNAGIHIINPSILDMVIEKRSVYRDSLIDRNHIKVDLDSQVLKPLAGSGKMYCYDSPEYVKDMGTPERLQQVCSDYKKGIVSKKNLSRKQKAIFLDRDGTINRYVGFLRDVSEFELLPDVIDAIKKINQSGYLAIVVTNQPVIARGEINELQLDEIHKKMETLLGAGGAYIDGLYYCPHHPDSGYEGERQELKIECECRKPKPGMLLEASERFNIELSESWMIGDSEADILAGSAVGCSTAYITAGEQNDYNADYTGESIKQIIDYILKD